MPIPSMRCPKTQLKGYKELALGPLHSQPYTDQPHQYFLQRFQMLSLGDEDIINEYTHPS